MKPVDMIDVRDDKHPDAVGDCFRACVASIFELIVGEVPHFMHIDKHAKFHWTYSLDQWLAPQGLWYSDFPEEVKTYTVFVPLKGIYGIGSGKSPRYPTENHSVVVSVTRFEGVKIVHDPHPSRAGLVNDKIEKVGLFLSRRFTING